jgi:zinc finger protein
VDDETKVDSGLTCPACDQPAMTMTQVKRDIPFFGKAHIYAMKCEECGYEDADVEAEEEKDPVRVTYTITSRDDLDTRVVRSSTGRIILDGIGSIEPKKKSMGFVTNLEGVLDRVEERVRLFVNDDHDEETREKAEDQLESIEAVRTGEDDLTITIEDHRGHSMIVDDEAETEPLHDEEQIKQR